MIIMSSKKTPESSIFVDWIKSITGWFKSLKNRRIRSIRLISQITFFMLLNGVILGLSRISFPAPVAMPAGSPFGTIWGGLDAVQFVLTSGNFPFLALGIFFLTSTILGKFTCGWICPVGFWQDIMSWLPISKTKVDKPTNSGLQEIAKWFLGIFLVFAAYVGYQNATGPTLVDNIWTRIPTQVLDPAGTLFVSLFYAFFWGILPGDGGLADVFDELGWLFFWKLLILLLVTFASIKIPRAYCRWICPTGALLALNSKNSLLTIKRDPLKCKDGCKECEDACPTGVPILDENVSGISNTLCINCGDCIDACPDAMSFAIRF